MPDIYVQAGPIANTIFLYLAGASVLYGLSALITKVRKR